MELQELGVERSGEDAVSEQSTGVTRRTLTKGLAWTVPAVGVGITATAAPAFAVSPFRCPDAGCYSTPATLGAATVAGIPQPAPGSNLTNVTTVGGTVTFTCVSQFGFLGGWTLWADSFTTSFTDHAPITSTAALTATTPSPLALPITVPGSTYIINGYPWDKANDGLLNVGQTAGHHISQICVNYTAVFYGLGIPPVALGTCRFQVCFKTAMAAGNWNTISLTKVSGPTPL